MILLLILAGVAINFAVGENGILQSAEYAVDKYENKAEQEQNELAKIDDYIENGRETVTISKEEYDILKNANTYSEEETKIGTWTNGKTIYRKIIELPKLNRGTDTIIGTIENVDCLIKSYGFSNDGTISATIPSKATCIYINGSTIYAYQDGNVYTEKPITVVLEYTKK